MKILQIVHSFPPYNIAGTEVYSQCLSHALSRRHDVSVFHRISSAQLNEYELSCAQLNGVKIYAINNTFKNCGSFEMIYKNEIVTDKFTQVLDRLNPDIVHIQHILFLSTSIVDEINRRKIPIVFTLHDYWLMCHQGQFLKNGKTICNEPSNFDCADCLRYQLSSRNGVMRIYQFIRKILPHQLLQLAKKCYFYYAKNTFLSQDRIVLQLKTRHKYIKRLCDSVDIFIAPSNYLRNKFVDFGIPDEKIKHITPGINVVSNQVRDKRSSNRIRFGFIGTLLPSKGVDVLIKTFNNVDSQKAELMIFGKAAFYKGFEYYPKYLKRLTKNENIRFMGAFENSEIHNILSDIDTLVVPSIWHENSPLVILEAFSAKTPVLASSIGGIPELIKDGVNGLLFNPGDHNELYTKIKLIINNPKILEMIKRNIQRPKDIEENAREIEGIYENFMAGVS